MKWLLALSIILLWLTRRKQQAAPVFNTETPSGQSWTEITGTSEDMTTGQNRGIRNKNPLNIEYSSRNNWRGQIGNDRRFCIFSHNKWGFRAAARVLRSYQRRGVNTIQSIVHTFAPSHENDSDHYADMVAKWSGIGKHDMIDARDNHTVATVIKAMARMEVGYQYSLNEVMEGVKLA